MGSHPDLIEPLLPLREPTFFILLSLTPGDQNHAYKHGYAIMKDVETLSRGKIRLSTSTLYEALARLLDQKLIERFDEPADTGKSPRENHPGKPRKTYRLTRLGRRVLEADRDRMQALLESANAVLSNQVA
jgi:DNA-binding PadR family transcriptional regulator